MSLILLFYKNTVATVASVAVIEKVCICKGFQAFKAATVGATKAFLLLQFSVCALFYCCSRPVCVLFYCCSLHGHATVLRSPPTNYKNVKRSVYFFCIIENFQLPYPFTICGKSPPRGTTRLLLRRYTILLTPAECYLERCTRATNPGVYLWTRFQIPFVPV